MEGVDLENQGGSNLGLFTLSNQQEVTGPRRLLASGVRGEIQAGEGSVRAEKHQ